MRWLSVFGLAGVWLVPGCDGPAEQRPTPDGTQRTSVYAVSQPVAWFAEQIGGELVEVHLPVPEGVDPANWRPTDEIVLRYQQADLILLHGADYAQWVRHAPLPESATVDTSAGFRDQLLEVPDAVVHAHGDHEPHAHAGLASYTWLDPNLAIEHARAVRDALAERLPEHADTFDVRFDKLAERWRELDERIAEAVAQDPDRPLLAFHPLYHYLEDRYSLNLHTMQWDRERDPSEHGWAALDEVLEAHPAEWMLWDREPSEAVATQLAARGIAVLVYSPADRLPRQRDWFKAMEGNVARLEAAFADESP